MQRELDIKQSTDQGCQTYGRGYLNSTSCPFREKVGFFINESEIDILKGNLGNEPSGLLKMRIKGRTGESFDVYIDYGEVIATWELAKGR